MRRIRVSEGSEGHFVELLGAEQRVELILAGDFFDFLQMAGLRKGRTGRR